MSDIVVAGEALIDRLVSPDGSVRSAVGGGPFNTARTIARLDRPVAFLGCLSTDDAGRQLRASLVADGVDDRLIVTTERPTTTALATLGASGSATYAFELEGTASPGLTADDATRASTPELAALHVGSLALVTEPSGGAIEHLVATIAPDVLVMLDPNCRPSAIADVHAYRARIAAVVRRADIVKASDDDLAFLAADGDPDRATDDLLAAGVRLVLRTRGPEPVAVRTPDGERQVPVPRVEVVDTVGAGDAFGGAFLAAWTTAGRTRAALDDLAAVVDATYFAVDVAGVTCSRRGADPPHLDELRR
jgi:fructokinase